MDIAGVDTEKDFFCDMGEVLFVAFFRYTEHIEGGREENFSRGEDSSRAIHFDLGKIVNNFKDVFVSF
ncbi:unnamed protein product, partial [marine sediment metagenome]